MRKTQVMLIGLLVLSALALVAGIGLTGSGQAAAGQAQPTSSGVQGVPTVTADEGTPEANADPYEAAFLTAFAGHLGVSEEQMNAAFAAAVADVADQAVRDGKLTQAQATSIKSMAAQNGLQSAVGKSIQMYLDGPDSNPKALLVDVMKPMQDAVASLLGLSTTDLQDQINGGQSVADIAAAHHIPVQQIQDTMLNVARTVAAAQVKDGKVTQAQADAALSAIANKFINSWINDKPSAQDMNNPKFRLGVVMPKVEEAEAALLGMSRDDLNNALDSGKTLADLASEHNVPLQQLKNTILTTLRAQLNAGVQGGRWTQAQADESYNLIANGIDVYVSQTWRRAQPR